MIIIKKAQQLKKEKGSIALTSVIILSTMLLLAGIGLIVATIDLTVATKSFYNINTARTEARGCLEESLYKITRNTSYTGTFSLTYSTGSCSATVANDVPSTTKIVTITGTVDSNNVTVVKKIDTAVSPFNITN